jgi:hypothetical protein
LQYPRPKGLVTFKDKKASKKQFILRGPFFFRLMCHLPPSLDGEKIDTIQSPSKDGGNWNNNWIPANTSSLRDGIFVTVHFNGRINQTTLTLLSRSDNTLNATFNNIRNTQSTRYTQKLTKKRFYTEGSFLQIKIWTLIYRTAYPSDFKRQTILTHKL